MERVRVDRGWGGREGGREEGASSHWEEGCGEDGCLPVAGAGGGCAAGRTSPTKRRKRLK
jgi:hypothetical protein